MLNEKGVSEVIGAILLVSLVILGAMIVAVLFLSQPPPQEIPQVNAIAGNNTTHIFLLHDGGDPLMSLETLIRIDGRADPVPAGDIELLREDGTVEESSWLSGEWSVGKTLRIRDDQTPQSVTLVYSGGSSQSLLLTSTFVEGSPIGPTGTVTTSPTGTATTTTTTVTTTVTTSVTTTTTTSPTPTPIPDCGTISGYKWNDLDGDGVWDTGEPGLSGWTVKAYECQTGNCNNLEEKGLVTTNPDGYYTFTGLTYQPSTKFKIEEVQQTGWKPTSPSQGYLIVQLEPPGSPGQPEKCFETNVNFGNIELPQADFEADPTSGVAPLTVQFTDLSTGNPTQWAWDVNNDGVTDYTSQNPEHTYASSGTYTVKLTVTNAGGSATKIKSGYITVTATSNADVIIDENVFIYGNNLEFGGSTINGPGATIIINGGLDTSDINGGASIAVTTIYFDGSVNLDGGSAGLGSSSNPGSIYVNGNMNLWGGSRNIYGDVYVAGNFDLKDARIHDTVYVDGDLTLGNTPTLDSNARIYYTGEIYYPQGYPQNILSKCIHQVSVPGFDMPDEGLPPLRPNDWYTARGYVSGGSLASNLKIFADSYSPTSSTSTAVNVVIIARNGDITLTNLGWIHVSGVLFAPNGRVTFSGDSFEGVVLTRDGFFVTSGGTDVTFRNFEEFFSSPDDYPF
ncbi:MAG: hypothetical protein APR55_01040 [Methanolinea sp. SDB]|nr:MAG: hypothetical protein APR55_01040 [Methanolinea sp. SDB]